MKVLPKIPNITRMSCIACLTIAALFTFGCNNNAPTSATNEIWGQSDALQTDINSKIPGYIDELLVKEGDVVKKGDLIAHVDAKAIEAKQGQVEAQMNAAKSQALQAKAAMELAALDKERIAKLYESDAISKQTYDQVVTKYNVSVEAYHQAEAAVEGYAKGVQEVSVNLGDTYIKSPMDGVISTKYVNTGSLVSTGMPIYSVQSQNENWVNFKVPETMLDQFKIGQKVSIEGRNQNLKLDGIIVEISQKPDFATKRATSERGDATDIIAFNVKVQINDPRIFPGMRFKLLGYTLPKGDS